LLPLVRIMIRALSLAWVDLPAAARLIYIVRFDKERKRNGAASYGIPKVEMAKPVLSYQIDTKPILELGRSWRNGLL
jgi:hypothetical protein